MVHSQGKVLLSSAHRVGSPHGRACRNHEVCMRPLTHRPFPHLTPSAWARTAREDSSLLSTYRLIGRVARSPIAVSGRFCGYDWRLPLALKKRKAAVVCLRLPLFPSSRRCDVFLLESFMLSRELSGCLMACGCPSGTHDGEHTDTPMFVTRHAVVTPQSLQPEDEPALFCSPSDLSDRLKKATGRGSAW